MLCHVTTVFQDKGRILNPKTCLPPPHYVCAFLDSLVVVCCTIASLCSFIWLLLHFKSHYQFPRLNCFLFGISKHSMICYTVLVLLVIEDHTMTHNCLLLHVCHLVSAGELSNWQSYFFFSCLQNEF